MIDENKCRRCGNNVCLYAQELTHDDCDWFEECDMGDVSDGYHTFDELYYHRMVLTAVIVHDHSSICWKAKKHADGTMFDGDFIVGLETPEGQATYHYGIEYWDMFQCAAFENAPEWDGHTPQQAIERIASLLDS